MTIEKAVFCYLLLCDWREMLDGDISSGCELISAVMLDTLTTLDRLAL